SLEVVWTPAELVLDQRTAGGTRTYAVDVPTGTTHLIARAPGASDLRLRRDAVVLCDGTDRCEVEQPVPGTWIVEVASNNTVHVEAGLLGDFTAPPPPPPPADDHGNDRFNATNLQYGSLDAHLDPGDSDWFEIVDWDAGSVVQTLGSTDTYGVVYDWHGNAILGND
ncbi:MAG: hypothetical protein KC656_38280, partial [Myxococcales bacterium]|nr:hypothetical protein [Myxococcales bacterium]